MLFPALLIVAVVFLAVILWVKQNGPGNIPAPPGLPIIFNTLELLMNYQRVLDWGNEMGDKLGPTITFKAIGSERVVFTCDPKNVEYMLKTNFDNFPKGKPLYYRMHQLLGQGIFSVDGDEWYTLRKVSSRLFNVRNFRDHMVTVFSKHCDHIVETLESVKPGEAVDMQDLYFRFTLDSVGEVGFGKDIGSLRDPNVPFATCFDYAQQMIARRFVFPYHPLLELTTPSGWKLRRVLKQLDDYAYDIVKERRQDKDVSNKADLLSLFMNRTREDGSEFNDKFLRDLIMNFLIAGRDTTAECLSWATYSVSQHPAVEARLVAEVDAAFATAAAEGHPGELSYEQVNKLVYTQAVVDETLRMYPSVPADFKFCAKGDTLPSGHIVPPGCFMAYSAYGMGRSAELWEEPLAFRPDRWLTGAPRPSPYVYPVFQAGPRTCLGQNMAYLEAKLALAQLYRKYKFRLVPGHVVQYQTSITLIMKQGLRMTVLRRGGGGDGQ